MGSDDAGKCRGRAVLGGGGEEQGLQRLTGMKMG